jgi:putative holliday junction resolvase
LADFGRVLGVDVGSKRVGIARTDLLRTSANSIGTFTPKDSYLEIEKQIRQEGPVKAIVVGWPLTPQDEPTHSTRLAGDYIRHLKKKYKDIPIHKMDERYSSKQAMEFMIESGIPRNKRHRKGRLDKAAAAVILQHFLEANPDL